ncbi:muscle LIM protein 1 isoform X3 [Polyergus mexicanus]|uniref:muscle LIM protein 1 isoform X3 n=1 Tax=Polyergus mexicanus TaxID=615972 RepID=UPI0038B6A080
MPFKPVEHPKCPKCGKSVYAAEERVAGGLKWHKQCFKCGLCGKSLDSTNCSEHEGELFCKVCHGRKFGPKGYGFGGGAGCLSMDQGDHLQAKSEDELSRGSNAILEPRAIAKAPEGEGCPRCGGYVYAAEQMLARGRVRDIYEWAGLESGSRIFPRVRAARGGNARSDLAHGAIIIGR